MKKERDRRQQAHSGEWYRTGNYETCCDCGLDATTPLLEEINLK